MVQVRGHVNLCFHGIGEPGRPLEPGEQQYWISPETFMGVLDLVQGRDDVRLSFDDGNASDLSIGLPALTARGLTATFFPIADRLRLPGSLSEADVKALVGEGMGIGSHGMSHIAWRRLAPERHQSELVLARRILQDVSGQPVDTAACPFGEYDRRAIALLRAEGYAGVFTSDRLPAADDQWLRPRYSLQAGDTVTAIAEIIDGPRSPSLLDRVRTTVKRWR